MFALATVVWLVGSMTLIFCVLAARRRRGALARELHELRGSLTAARLAVDLMPALGAEQPSVCRAASDELERSYRSLGEFEELLHSRLIAPPFGRTDAPAPGMVKRARKARIDAREELERLALIWNEAARREGRTLVLEWNGPQIGVMANGPRRSFVEVVANLIANAIQHGEGEIRIVARMRSDRLRVEVSDEGPGLSRPIGQIARRVGAGAHGYGLSIANQAARRLGGSLTSAPASHGATVVFTVPAVHDPTCDDAVAGIAALSSGDGE